MSEQYCTVLGRNNLGFRDDPAPTAELTIIVSYRLQKNLENTSHDIGDSVECVVSIPSVP